MLLKAAATTAFIALAIAAPNPLPDNPAPTSAPPPPSSSAHPPPSSVHSGPIQGPPTGSFHPKPTHAPRPNMPAFLDAVDTTDCLFAGGKQKGGRITIGSAIYVNRTCQKFAPGSNNVHLYFGKGNKLVNGLTLYTDQNCKNVGKAGEIKKKGDMDSTCLHPSDFGGETWGSVMQTA